MEHTLIGLLGAAATVIVGLLSLCGVLFKRRNNNPGPHPQPCMEGGSLLSEFRLFAENLKDDNRELRSKVDTLINLVGQIGNRVPRP